jgi:hypothetical protein
MRKVQFIAVGFTLALAVPFTVVALAGAAWLTNHLPEIGMAVNGLLNWRGLAVEGSARWPEVAGMILSILLLVRRNGKAVNGTDEGQLV